MGRRDSTTPAQRGRQARQARPDPGPARSPQPAQSAAARRSTIGQGRRMQAVSSALRTIIRCRTYAPSRLGARACSGRPGRRRSRATSRGRARSTATRSSSPGNRTTSSKPPTSRKAERRTIAAQAAKPSTSGPGPSGCTAERCHRQGRAQRVQPLARPTSIRPASRPRRGWAANRAAARSSAPGAHQLSSSANAAVRRPRGPRAPTVRAARADVALQLDDPCLGERGPDRGHAVVGGPVVAEDHRPLVVRQRPQQVLAPVAGRDHDRDGAHHRAPFRCALLTRSLVPRRRRSTRRAARTSPQPGDLRIRRAPAVAFGVMTGDPGGLLCSPPSGPSRGPPARLESCVVLRPQCPRRRADGRPRPG